MTYAWNDLGGLTSCPAGMNMVGDSGKHATYCIDANARLGQVYESAVRTCYDVNDSTAGRAHVCDFSEWNTACVKGLASVMTGHWEWVSAPYGDYWGGNYVTTVGYSGCSVASDGSPGVSYSFHCCVR